LERFGTTVCKDMPFGLE